MKRLFLLLVLLGFSPLSVLHAAASPKSQADSPASAQADTTGGTVSITAKADAVTPYQNQPVLYTVRVVVRTGVSNTTITDISIANAIVEATGDPDISDQIENGMPVKVAEFHYIITPLQPGKMTIPPATLQGKFQAPNLATLADPSGSFAFSSGTQKSLNFFSTYGGEPFTITSNAMQLNVKPPVAAMDPWLPLTSLRISEKMDASKSTHVGEPLTRTVTLSATGAVGSQLPDIGAQQQTGNFRAYADRPAMGENVDKKAGVISGWRTDSYSVIAQSAGHLVLPAIRISWWDVANNKAALAELPERIVNILPAVAAPKPTINGDQTENQNQAGKSQQGRPHWLQNALSGAGLALLYVFIGLAIIALLFGIFRRQEAQRKILHIGGAFLASMRLKTGPQASSSDISSTGTLFGVQTAEQLQLFLRAYAHQHWGTSKNASLEKIFSLYPGSRTKREHDDVQTVTNGIGAALYADRTADMEDLKKRSRRVIRVLKRNTKRAKKSREELPRLNPS